MGYLVSEYPGYSILRYSDRENGPKRLLLATFFVLFNSTGYPPGNCYVHRVIQFLHDKYFSQYFSPGDPHLFPGLSESTSSIPHHQSSLKDIVIGQDT